MQGYYRPKESNRGLKSKMLIKVMWSVFWYTAFKYNSSVSARKLDQVQ